MLTEHLEVCREEDDDRNILDLGNLEEYYDSDEDEGDDDDVDDDEDDDGDEADDVDDPKYSLSDDKSSGEEIFSIEKLFSIY